MKTRQDFVSNSSSCSFIIHLKTDNDVKAIKGLFDRFQKDYVNFSYSFQNDGLFQDNYVGSKDDFVKGTLVKVDTGEDHSMYYRERYEEILDAFRDAYKFRIYADPDAHLTVYEKIPKNITL